MSPTATALAAQAALIAARRAEQLAELKRHSADCIYCGEGPTDGRKLRAVNLGPWGDLQLICRACFDGRGEEMDFTDFPLAWAKIEDANR